MRWSVFFHDPTLLKAVWKHSGRCSEMYNPCVSFRIPARLNIESDLVFAVSSRYYDFPWLVWGLATHWLLDRDVHLNLARVLPHPNAKLFSQNDYGWQIRFLTSIIVQKKHAAKSNLPLCNARLFEDGPSFHITITFRRNIFLNPVHVSVATIGPCSRRVCVFQTFLSLLLFKWFFFSECLFL